jgi:hypothetical protein
MLLDIVALTASVSAYGLCSRTNHRFSANLPTVPIQGTATRSVTVNNSVVPVSVSGSIRVVDGCSFQFVNATITGPASLQFFGGRAESDPNAVRLTTDTVTLPLSSSSATYTFIQTAGNWVNYNDFIQINFYDPATSAVFAQAILPGQPNVTSTATGVASTRSGTSTSASPASSTSSSPSPGVTSGVERIGLGLTGLASIAFLLF